MTNKEPNIRKINMKPEPKPEKIENPTCMFCKQIQSESIKMFEIIINNPDDNTQKTHHICEDCMEHMQSFLAEITRTPLQNPEKDDPTPERAFVGMQLNQFLCTQMYIATTYEIIFYDCEGIEITEFTNYMKHKITHIRKDEENNQIHIILDE